MISLLLRHEIQVLLRAGHAEAEVAARVGVSVRTVRRVIAEGTVTHADDAIERRERKIGRPSKAALFAPKVSAWLTAEPNVSTQELLHRAMEAGYTGHKTAFYALVARLRRLPATPEPPAPLPEHRAAKRRGGRT